MTAENVGFVVGTLGEDNSKHLLFQWRRNQKDLYVWRQEKKDVWGWSGTADNVINSDIGTNGAEIALVYKNGKYYAFLNGTQVCAIGIAIDNGWGGMLNVSEIIGTEGALKVGLSVAYGMVQFTNVGFSTDKTEINIETLGGIKKIYLSLKDGHVSNITANIGAPVLEAAAVPAVTKSERFLDKTVILDGRKFSTTAISLGNPHCVSFVDDLDELDLEKYGPLMENNPLFPNRINAEFCHVVSRNHLKLRTWERGTGETLACATGCSTCTVGGVLTDRCDRHVSVEQIGGVTEIEWNADDNCIYMTAPSEIVFDGTLYLPDYLCV
jgi:diaminopimelate epimerase